MSTIHPEHDERHREKLAEILSSENLEAAFAASGLVSCDACCAEMEWYRSLVLDVRALGAEEATELAEARAQTSAPGEDRLLEALRSEMGRDAGGRMLGGPDRFAWLAAALMLLALGAAFWPRRGDAGPKPGYDVTMAADGVRLVSPGCRYDNNVTFEWAADKAEHLTFVLRIWDASRPGDPVFEVTIREGTSWKPGAAEFERLPPKLRWNVTPHDPSNTELAPSPDGYSRRSSD